MYPRALQDCQKSQLSHISREGSCNVEVTWLLAPFYKTVWVNEALSLVTNPGYRFRIT